MIGIIDELLALVPLIAIAVVMGVGGWVITTWLRVKHGYPLEDQNGRALYPHKTAENEERIRLLTQENAQLRAELGSVKDRLAVIERIVTDGSHRLDREIEMLRDKPLN